MTGLPWDAMVDILSRLAVKDLLRYRCVSKSWRSLIDGHDFIKKHLNHSVQTNSNLSVIIRSISDLFWFDSDALDSAVKLNHPMLVYGGITVVLGSCNGLLALWNWANCHYREQVFCLWNPSTRSYKKLPSIEFPVKFHWAFHGFGYDPINDDYKLVRMVQFFDDDSFRSDVKVYSLNSNTWKKISDFPYYFSFECGYGVLANNALHWLVSGVPKSKVSDIIVAFDLVTEEYREVPLFEFEGDEKLFLNVYALGGFLCALLSYTVDVGNTDHVDIWVMKEYGVKESWTKLFVVAASEVISPFSYVLPLAFLKTGDQVVLNRNGASFILYNLESKRVKNVRISGVPDNFEAHVCVGSLVGLNGSDWQLGWKPAEDNMKKKKDDNQKRRRTSGKQRDDFLSKGFKLVL